MCIAILYLKTISNHHIQKHLLSTINFKTRIQVQSTFDFSSSLFRRGKINKNKKNTINDHNEHKKYLPNHAVIDFLKLKLYSHGI